MMALCCLILFSSSSQLMMYDLDRGSGFPFRQRTVWHLPTLAEVNVKEPPRSTGSCLMWHRTAAPPSFCPAVPSFLNPKRRVNIQTPQLILFIKKDYISAQDPFHQSHLASQKKKVSGIWQQTHSHTDVSAHMGREVSALLKARIASPGLLCPAGYPASVMWPQQYILSPPTSPKHLCSHINQNRNKHRIESPHRHCRLTLSIILLKYQGKAVIALYSQEFLDQHYLFYKTYRDSILVSTIMCFCFILLFVY